MLDWVANKTFLAANLNQRMNRVSMFDSRSAIGEGGNLLNSVLLLVDKMSFVQQVAVALYRADAIGE